MKNRKSTFYRGLAATTVAAAWLGISGMDAQAQSTSTTTTASKAIPVAANNLAPVLPYGANEVVKLYQGGVSQGVITNYIYNTSLPYNLSSSDVAYLKTLGIPQNLITAMTQRDSQLQQQAMLQNSQTQSVPPPVPPGTVVAQSPSEVVTPTTPAPAVTVVGSDDPYDYDYPPYYDYGADYYGWPVVIGGGWGGYGGFHGGYGGFHGGGGFRGGGGGFHGDGGGFHGGGGFGGGHGGGGGHR